MAVDPARQSVRKKVEKYADLINEILMEDLEEDYIPIIIEMIMRDYDIELTGRVTDRSSRTNPIYYREEFEQALWDYDWITEGLRKFTFSVPETNTFNWNQGRLRIIENIVDGTIGNYYEVDEQQYIRLYGKRPIVQPFDKAVPIKERIYLLRQNTNFFQRWRENFPKENPVKFPFSNTPPINIFETADRYVGENLNSWIDTATEKATKEIYK